MQIGCSSAVGINLVVIRWWWFFVVCFNLHSSFFLNIYKERMTRHDHGQIEGTMRIAEVLCMQIWRFQNHCIFYSFHTLNLINFCFSAPVRLVFSTVFLVSIIDVYYCCRKSLEYMTKPILFWQWLRMGTYINFFPPSHLNDIEKYEHTQIMNFQFSKTLRTDCGGNIERIWCV